MLPQSQPAQLAANDGLDYAHSAVTVVQAPAASPGVSFLGQLAARKIVRVAAWSRAQGGFGWVPRQPDQPQRRVRYERGAGRGGCAGTKACRPKSQHQWRDRCGLRGRRSTAGWSVLRRCRSIPVFQARTTHRADDATIAPADVVTRAEFVHALKNEVPDALRGR
jgi:hypothetical protein